MRRRTRENEDVEEESSSPNVIVPIIISIILNHFGSIGVRTLPFWHYWVSAPCSVGCPHPAALCAAHSAIRWERAGEQEQPQQQQQYASQVTNTVPHRHEA